MEIFSRGLSFSRGDCKVFGSQESQARSLLVRAATVSEMYPHSLALDLPPKVVRRNMMMKLRLG